MTTPNAVIDFLMNQPGIRGIWPLTSYRANEEVRDMLGELHLTRTGVALDSIDDVRAAHFAAVTDNLSHTDAAAFDTLGNEAYVNTGNNLRGMTVGLWVRFSDFDSQRQLISKWLPAGGQRSWMIDTTLGFGTRFIVSGNGVSSFAVSTATPAILPNTWYFVAARLRNETPQIKVWVNLTSNTNATTPSTLFNSTAAFRIGQRADSADGFVGHARFAFLAHAAWPDHIVEEYAVLSAPLFGLDFDQPPAVTIPATLQLTTAIQNSIHAGQPIVWAGTDLTGATLTGRIRSLKSGITRNIEGTLTITSAVNGRFDWLYDPADVVEAGLFEVQFTATFSGAPHKHLIANWDVAPAI